MSLEYKEILVPGLGAIATEEQARDWLWRANWCTALFQTPSDGSWEPTTASGQGISLAISTNISSDSTGGTIQTPYGIERFSLAPLQTTP